MLLNKKRTHTTKKELQLAQGFLIFLISFKLVKNGQYDIGGFVERLVNLDVIK